MTALGSVEARSGQEVERLRRQVEVMLGYVLDRGLSPAPQAWMFEAIRQRGSVVDLGSDGWNPAGADADRLLGTEALVRAHRELSRSIAPARPATLELLNGYREGRRPSRLSRIPRQKRNPNLPNGTARPIPRPGSGPGAESASGAGSVVAARRGLLPGGSTVPLVRWLMLAALLFLVAFVLLASTPQARAASAGLNLDGVSHQTFQALLLRELFLLCAAALGASLTALYRAGKEVARGSYDPEFDHTFLQRILLGMAAGLVLAELVPFEAHGDTPLATLGRPAIALVGGFAADVAHSVLSRLVAALATLFNGDQEDQENARRELAQKRADEVLAQADRASLTKLLEIRRIASSGAPTRAIIEEIDRLITMVAAPG